MAHVSQRSVVGLRRLLARRSVHAPSVRGRPDYRSRRSGNQEENLRRRSSDTYRPRESNGGYDAPSSSRSRSPPVQRKRSMDYSSRRSGGQEENSRRRSGDLRAPSPSSDYEPRSQPQRRRSMPQRRTSPDYASRRGGSSGQEENIRRSQDIRAPSPPRWEEPAARQSERQDYEDYSSRQMPRRRRSSPDYSSRRSGGQEENTRRRSADYQGSSRSYDSYDSYDSRNSQSSRSGSPRRSPVRRRSSTDYPSRRSGGQEENMRRRSADLNGRGVPEPAGEGPPNYYRKPHIRRRPSTDYASRRSGSQEENNRRRSPPVVPLEATGSYDRSDGYSSFSSAVQDDDYYSRDSSSSRTAGGVVPRKVRRTTADFDPTKSRPDYLRLAALSMPAALLLLGGVIATDFVTDYQLTEFLIRYGGPGAPIYSLCTFWGCVLLAWAGLGAFLTNLALPDAFILRGPCPECGAPNQAYFGDVFGVKGNRTVTVVECENCMADVSFELGSREVRLVKSSATKRAAAIDLARRKEASAAKKAAKAARG